MTQLVLTPSFKRASRRVTRRDKAKQKRIDDTLQLMHENVFDPQLGTHKLSGNLAGLWACSCGYDCRIVFAIDQDPETSETIILLVDIGTHDEVY